METVTTARTTARATAAGHSDEAEAELAARLRLSVLRLARRLRREAGAEITASQLSALSSLRRSGSLTLGELSAVERVKPPTMTRIVASLEELGLVARSVDASDRRVARVEVTASGQGFLDRSRHRKDAYLAARLRDLDEADRGALTNAVDALERLLDAPE
jgi:DNA-binding MarR family transcriptional regulator